MLKNLYKQELMDHYSHPRNQEKIASYTHASQRINPSCGDKVQFYLFVSEGKIQNVSFEGSGCVLSIAAASKLSEKIKGMVLTDVLGLNQEYMQNLIGMEIGFNRMQCILLPLESVKNALEKGI